MSWDQGVEPRENLPRRFLEWADAKGGAPLRYITWFGFEPPIYLDFGEAGSLETNMGIREFSAKLAALDE